MAGGSIFEVWTWMASLGFLAMLQQFIPREYTDGFRRTIRSWLRRMTPYIYCDFHEFDNATTNKLYQDVQMYLSTVTLEGALRVNMCKSKASRAATFSLANDEGIVDKFDGAHLHWVHRVDDRQRPQYFNYYESRSEEKRKFTLRISKKNKERMLDKYVEHIEKKAKELTREARDLQLYTNSKGQDYYSRKKRWESVSFLHPANFDTLALDGDLKSKIIMDLENFANNEKYYKRVGKAWKRGYLLYGPPGTGKSSMIAAIANKMRYDVYDLELTEVESNAQLRKLLLQTSNKAVIVIEDIDCSLDLSGQRKKAKKKEDSTPPGIPPPPKPDEQSKVTLSGLLNFVDGLWSCCGSERIFIFTTNFVEKLDPALLRAGRMDMHIHLSYCTFSAFKVLCKNYLQVEDHEMFEEVEKAFEGSFMTPAEVSEVLIKSQDDKASVALQSLITTLGEHREDPRIKAEAEAAAEAKEAEEEEKKEKEKEEKKEKEKEEKEEKKEKEKEEKKKKEKEEKKKKKRDEEKAKAADDANAISKEEADEKTSAEMDEVKEMKSKESPKGVRSSGPKIVPVDEADVEPEKNSSDTKLVKESPRKTHSSFSAVAGDETPTVTTNTNVQEKVEE